MESGKCFCREGLTCPNHPPGCQPSDCCGDPSVHGRAVSEEAVPLAGATVLQSGDAVLLCMASEPDSETTRAICKQLTEKYPNIHFGLVTGVTGVLIRRGNNDDSAGEADDTERSS